MNNTSTFNAWAAYIAVAFFWGTTFLAIRIGVQSMPPFLMAGFRHFTAGLLIWGYFMMRGYPRPTMQQLKLCVINGVLLLVLGNGLVSWAEMYITSGLTALICALSPLAILGANALMGNREKITVAVVVGIVMCLVAQVLIFKNNLHELTDPHYLQGIVFLLIAIASWGLGSMFIKNNPTGLHPLYGASFQMLSAGAILLVVGSVLGEWKTFEPTQEGLSSIVYLIVVGSLIGYGSYMYILKHLPAAIVSTYAYVNTLVAVVLGWLWLDEPVDGWVWTAAVMTIAGVYLVNKSFQKTASEKT